MNMARQWRALCRLIAQAEETPRLTELAASAGLSPFHFHRVFKAITGLTPKSYAFAYRAKRLVEALPGANTVTRAIYEAGFNSSGRFYEASQNLLGMTPTRYRSGGRDIVIRFAVGECSLGSILVASTEKGLCAILFGDDPEALVRDIQDRFPKAKLVGGDREFEELIAKVVGFVEEPGVGFDLPLDVRGTAFQQRVWQALTRPGPAPDDSFKLSFCPVVCADLLVARPLNLGRLGPRSNSVIPVMSAA
jgi:AraC family transcriptional regulator, regulatory protein of adaptative response / methylated-DNA-[protein]-cysteine methyltransferase